VRTGPFPRRREDRVGRALDAVWVRQIANARAMHPRWGVERDAGRGEQQSWASPERPGQGEAEQDESSVQWAWPHPEAQCSGPGLILKPEPFEPVPVGAQWLPAAQSLRGGLEPLAAAKQAQSSQGCEGVCGCLQLLSYSKNLDVSF